ncbi:MAG: tetratricopeptide repeat protein [Gemmatimonadota bacterium]
MNEHESKTGFGHFWAEMRRRHVVRFALGYAAAVFVLLQLAEIVFPAFGIGEGGVRLLVIVTTLGFIPAIVLAWLYDLTRDGVRRTDADGEESAGRQPLAIGGLLVVTVAITGGLGMWLESQGTFDRAVADLDGSSPGDAPVELVAYDPNEPIRSVAVLPLRDNSPNGDQAYLAAGMHEELITKLSMLDDVRVVSRTSVMQYEGTTTSIARIGQELDADVVIEGSVVRQGERTRVTLRLMHAASDSEITTLQWDRESVTDVLGFQDEVAHDLVMAVTDRYDDTTMPVSVASIAPEAQDAYFRGRYEADRGTLEGLRSAIGFFEDAVEAHPDFAEAMAGMAGARFIIGLSEDEISEAELTRAHEEALTAVRLDSSSAEAQEVLTLIETSLPTLMDDFAIEAPETGTKEIHVMAFDDMGESIEVDVSAFDTAWVATVTTMGEQIQDRVTRWRSDHEGRPAGSGLAFQARQHLAGGRWGEASDLLEAAIAESPEMAPAWEMLVRSRMAMGDNDAARTAVQAWHDSGAPGAPSETDVANLTLAIELQGSDGYWQWTAQRLQQMEAEGRPVPRMEFATTHAALGNADEAFAYLLEALERGEPTIMSIRSDPAWDELRADPRLREIGRQAQEVFRSMPRRRPPGPRGNRN